MPFLSNSRAHKNYLTPDEMVQFCSFSKGTKLSWIPIDCVSLSKMGKKMKAVSSLNKVKNAGFFFFIKFKGAHIHVTPD